MPVNFASSQVVTAPSPATSGTTLTVVPGHGANFPSVPFNAVIADSSEVLRTLSRESEIVRVTNIATDTLTIEREVEGTTARTILVGDRVYAGVTGGITTRYVPSMGTHSMIAGPVALPPISIAADAGPFGWYAVRIVIFSEATITGIRYLTGDTSVDGTVKSALYNSAGSRLAFRTTGANQPGTGVIQAVAFDSAYSADPGIYYALLLFSSLDGSFFASVYLTAVDLGSTAGATPASISPSVPSFATNVPILGTY